jgi:hypothetical protein
LIHALRSSLLIGVGAMNRPFVDGPTMLAPIYPPSAAAPLLFLSLVKIARTPTPRLRVGYQVTPRYPLCAERPLRPFIAHCVQTDKNLRRLGQALLLDRYLAGGIVGTELPLSIAGAIDTRPLANLALDAAYNANANGLDVWA